MMQVVIVICLIIAIIISVIVANAFQEVAIYKGYSSRKYFWFTFFFGIVGCLLVIALPDRGLVRRARPQNDELPDL